MRGMAMAINRSRNSHIRSPRSVTLQPIDWPSRSLNPAIDLPALVMIGFCPLIAVRSRTAPSSSDGCWVARPTPLLMTIFFSFISQHLRGERDDPHEPLVAQLAADWAEDARAARGEVVLDDDGGVLVEADVAAVGTAALLLRAHDDALDDVALLDTGTRDGVLDGGDEDVADAGVATAGAAEHLDAQHLLGAAVVGDAEA